MAEFLLCGPINCYHGDLTANYNIHTVLNCLCQKQHLLKNCFGKESNKFFRVIFLDLKFLDLIFLHLELKLESVHEIVISLCFL